MSENKVQRAVSLKVMFTDYEISANNTGSIHIRNTLDGSKVTIYTPAWQSVKLSVDELLEELREHP